MGKKQRKEVEILAASGTLVTLGGREYTITPKPIGISRPIRHKLSELLKEAGEMSGLFSALTSKQEVELNGEQAESGLSWMASLVGERLDEFYEIVYAYEPTIAADRKWLEGEEEPGEGAMDEDFVHALVVIGGFCFPFLKMAGLMTTAMTGLNQANSGNGGETSSAKQP